MLKREVKGRVFYEVKLSFLIYLVVLFSSAASEVLHSDVGTRIIIKPDEFLPPDKHIASYPSTSLAQCMALVQSKHDSKGFCVTPDDRCLVLIFTYPPNYDDGSGEDDHLCYTMEEPSIDIGLCTIIISLFHYSRGNIVQVKNINRNNSQVAKRKKCTIRKL